MMEPIRITFSEEEMLENPTQRKARVEIRDIEFQG
jgi:hypothetical protein